MRSNPTWRIRGVVLRKYLQINGVICQVFTTAPVWLGGFGFMICHMQAVSQEGDEDMGLDPAFELMVNGAQAQVVLEVLEGPLHLGELDIKVPQLFRWTTRDDVRA